MKERKKVASTTRLTSRLQNDKVVCGEGCSASTHSASSLVHQSYLNTLGSQPTASIPMSFFSNNDFAGVNFGYSLGDEEFPGIGDHYDPLLDSDGPVAGPSRTQHLCLNPSPGGYASQSGYQESTLLNAWEDDIVDPYSSHAEPAYNGFDSGESRCHQSRCLSQH